MKKATAFALFVLSLMLLLPAAGMTRSIGPVVSTDRLAGNTPDPKIVIIDIRKVEDYKAGHIPKAVSIFYNTWAITEGKLRNQVPQPDDLADIINSAGIAPDSKVVVVGNSDTLPNRTNITRVAWTLKYAGIEDVAVLDGREDPRPHDVLVPDDLAQVPHRCGTALRPGTGRGHGQG